jgi:hypothetical protein
MDLLCISVTSIVVSMAILFLILLIMNGIHDENCWMTLMAGGTMMLVLVRKLEDCDEKKSAY